MIEAEFVLGGLEAVLDSPAMAFDQHQLLHWRALGAPGGEEGQIAVGNVAADQETPRPLSSEGAVVFAGLEIGQFEVGPVVQARTFGSFARRQAPPSALGKALRDLRGTAANELLFAPGVEHVVGGNAQDIAPRIKSGGGLLPALRSMISMSPVPYTLSAATKENGALAAMARAIIRRAIWGLDAKLTSSGTCAAFRRLGSSVHSFGR